MKKLNNYLFIFILTFLLTSCSEEKDYIDKASSIEETSEALRRAKPSNIPSKAPSSVICNYFAINGNTPSAVASYCGFYWSGQSIPPPQSVLDAVFGTIRNHSFNDLYILAPNSPNGIMPFSSYTLPDNLSVRSEIISFYQKVYQLQINQSITVTGNINQAEHIHKQAFIDSFFQWMNRLQISQPNSFNLLMNNNVVYRQMFNLFTEYNLNQPASIGIYLGVPNGQNSSNQRLRCLTVTSEFLLTQSGSLLLQSLNSGNITIEQFKTQLNLLCS